MGNRWAREESNHPLDVPAVTQEMVRLLSNEIGDRLHFRTSSKPADPADLRHTFVAFPLTAEDFKMPLEEFVATHLEPAALALAQQLMRLAEDAGTDVLSMTGLPLLDGLDPCCAYNYQGIAVRASYHYDIMWRRPELAFETLCWAAT